MYIFHQFTPIVEILIIAIFINFLLSFFWDNERSKDLILGLVTFIFIFAVSSLLDFPILHKLMLLVANVAVIAILIIFQPELRIALSQLSFKGKQFREITEFDHFLNGLISTLYKFAKKKVGALVILEYEKSLREYCANEGQGIILDANFNKRLLESIFLPLSALHDGAVVISGNKIYAASVMILELSDQKNLPKSFGTRHRAALGISEKTDAIALLVSEEKGVVSMARRGILHRDIKEENLYSTLKNIYKPQESAPKPKVRGFKGKMRAIWGWIKE